MPEHYPKGGGRKGLNFNRTCIIKQSVIVLKGYTLTVIHLLSTVP